MGNLSDLVGSNPQRLMDAASPALRAAVHRHLERSADRGTAGFNSTITSAS
ncbi:hypothetical protein [Nocardia yamanashiensis]|uniref:hypothetical protein n=1 Tax=Nocardia yamanashiensis TaxID=209247 RepID=UPI000A9AEEE7|nr:hypothetical protein [Nocardia yamanashiensis]